MKRCAALLCASLLCAGGARAEELAGRVIGVADGDTLTLLTADRRQHKIHLAGIDAPERGQQGAHRAKESLAGLVYERAARAECHGVDAAGGKVCKVWAQPSDCARCGLTLDVGLAQISVGRAWWARRDAGALSPEDRARYQSEENEARLRKRGLWAQADPVPPWAWRAARP